MADMTFGQMMLADILPPDIYQPGVAINKKRLNEMMGQVAQRYPDRYADIAHRLVRLGLKSGESMGGASFGLKDLATTPVVRARQEEIRNEMKELLDNTPEDQQQEAIVKLLRRHSKEMPELVYQDGVANKNRFTLQLEGAGRGNKKSLSSMMAGDILVENSVGEPIPVPISRGYGQGQTLGQYYATAYGARRGITATKLSVGSSGYFCFPASVNVRMADGSVKSIALVAPGDLVLGADVAGNTFPVRVLNRWANGMQAVNRYRVRKLAQRKGHFEFEATPGHEMLVRVDAYYKSRFPVSQAHVEQGTNTRVKLGKCRKLKCRLVLNGPSVTWSGTRNEPYAWVIGYLIGNGGLTSGGVCFSTADAEVLRSFVDVLGSDQFMVNKGRTRDLDYEYRLVDLRPLSKVAVRTTEDLGTHRLRRRLRSLGLIGKKAQEKFIPDEVWSWSKGSICELIAGLLEADGCFSLTQLGSVTMRFSVTSAAISHRLKELMAVVLGVHATSVTEYVCHDTEPGKVIKYKVKSNFNMHELSVTGYENVDRLLKQLPIRGSKIRKSREMFAAREYGSRYTVTASILSELPAGEREVYDLEVDHPDHLYVLESGLVVSNSKLLQQAGHRLVVVGDDDDKADPDEQRGLLVDAADPDNVGALLARDIGPYRRNTVITPSMLTALHRLGNGQVLIRSPIASSSLSGGLYARDVGVREFGRLARRGEHVGNPASQAIGEQVTQMSLSSKHSGGAAGDEKTQPGLSGFALVERLANPPKEGRGLAIHAQHDGKVQDVRPAPQGGTYLTIGGKEHYVPPDFTMTVRQGDVVEAGDELTDGVADPAEVVRHKGIGEGRRYFVNSMRRALQESGAPVDRRNLELLATGLINRVRVDRQFGEFMPGSLVSYGRVEKLYRPRKDSQRTALEGAAGRYLERPALHYSIGTRLTPKILDGLKRGGIKEVVSHTEAPPFTAVPVRAADALQSDPDFMTQFFGSHLQKNLLKSIQAGGESDENSTSFVPLRAGGVNLGRPGFLLSGS